MKTNTVLLVLWTLLLLGALLYPMRESPFAETGWLPHLDKVIHFGLFTVTGFVSIYGAGFFLKLRSRLLFGLGFGLALAIGTEFGQYFMPFRDLEFYDLLADLAGLFLGLFSAALLYCWRLKL